MRTASEHSSMAGEGISNLLYFHMIDYYKTDCRFWVAVPQFQSTIYPLTCLFIFVQIYLFLSDLLPKGMNRYPVLWVIYCRYGIVRAATKCAQVFSGFPLPLQTANNSNPHIEVTHRISLEIISRQKGKRKAFLFL